MHISNQKWSIITNAKEFQSTLAYKIFKNLINKRSILRRHESRRKEILIVKNWNDQENVERKYTLSSFEIRKKLIDKGANVRTSTTENHQIWESIIIKAKYFYNDFNIESNVNKKMCLKIFVRR